MKLLATFFVFVFSCTCAAIAFNEQPVITALRAVDVEAADMHMYIGDADKIARFEQDAQETLAKKKTELLAPPEAGGATSGGGADELSELEKRFEAAKTALVAGKVNPVNHGLSIVVKKAADVPLQFVVAFGMFYYARLQLVG